MFDAFLVCGKPLRRIHLAWSKSIPGLLRVPLFSSDLNRGFVISYVEKSRRYELVSFDPVNGRIDWSCNLFNGGYGSPAVGHNLVAVPTRFVDVTGVDARSGEIVWTWKGHARVRSPIGLLENGFLFSCGPSIVAVDERGAETRRINRAGVFFYGLVRSIPSRAGQLLVSHATWTGANGRSQAGVFAFGLQGNLEWQVDLGEAQVISSDTSGFAVTEDVLYCAAGRCVKAVHTSDGSQLWAVPTGALVGRQMPVVARGRVLVPSVSGDVLCLSAATGEELWRFTDTSIVNTPVSVLGDLALVSVNGQIRMLSLETGRPFDQIATGHSPYSAVTFFGERAFIGGGDPPYHGRLYAFDLVDRSAPQPFVCRTETVGARDDHESFILHVEVANIEQPISEISLDASVLSEDITNGARGMVSLVERVGNRFSFEIPLRSTIIAGLYCVDLDLVLESGRTVSRTALVDIACSSTLPNRMVLHGIIPIAQVSPHHSGAAVVDMAKRYYGQKPVDQVKFRKLVDDIRQAANYEPFNLWRIVTRRALSTSEDSFERLPEVRNGSIKISSPE